MGTDWKTIPLSYLLKQRLVIRYFRPKLLFLCLNNNYNNNNNFVFTSCLLFQLHPCLRQSNPKVFSELCRISDLLIL